MVSKYDWGELDGDCLNSILSNIFGKDRISFSLVCKHWRSVAADSPYRCSPCLAYYHRRSRSWKFYQPNGFFDSSFPELENAELRCSKYGWLLMSRYDDDTLFFFDTSNNRKVELPCKVDEQYCYPLSFFNPPTSSECVVVGIQTVESSGEVGICILKHGDDEWEKLKFSIDKPGRDFVVLLGAPVLHRGLIYFLSVEGDVAILDIKEGTLDINFDCLFPERDEKYDIREQYLVKVKGEDEALYGVFVFDDEREVHLFRLSSDMKKWDLLEGGIGDRVFYISHYSCFGDKARSKSMENAVCFPMFRGDVPVFYSLSDAKYHSLDGGYSEGNAYGVKKVTRATWLIPMPLQQDITATISWVT